MPRLCSIFIVVLSIHQWFGGRTEEIILWSRSECGGEVIPGLLLVDKTSLFASDEPHIKYSLDVLFRWCNEWGVKINVYQG